MNPQVRIPSGTTPGTFRSTDVENQQPSGDRSPNDLHPGVEFCACRVSNITDSDPEETSHIVTGVQEETPYCSPGTSLGKQKKARSTCGPQFRSENIPATTEADQILLAFQQVASNSNSAIFNNNNSNKISRLPKSLTATTPIFEGKLETFEMFEEKFQTAMNNHNQLTEEDKIQYLASHLRGDDLQNISSPGRENSAEILTVFRRKYGKPQSMARSKHKFWQLVFNPANLNLIVFFGRTRESSERRFESCCPSDNLTVQKCKIASPPEKKNKLFRLIWRLAQMNRLCGILNGSWR